MSMSHRKQAPTDAITTLFDPREDSDNIRQTLVDRPRQAEARIVAGMDVIASDGQKVGTVDHLEGTDKIKLAKRTSADGRHHFIPLIWVEHVDRHVHLNKPSLQVKSGW